MKRHPRAAIVAPAGAAIILKVSVVTDEYDLTETELAKILNEQMASVIKYRLRAERHPEDPETPADVE